MAGVQRKAAPELPGPPTGSANSVGAADQEVRSLETACKLDGACRCEVTRAA